MKYIVLGGFMMLAGAIGISGLSIAEGIGDFIDGTTLMVLFFLTFLVGLAFGFAGVLKKEKQ